MADSASPVLLQRIQSVGSNVNLWGGHINTDLEILEQASKGYQTQALTGDTTIAWTNYATGNKGAAALLKFTGSLAATATVTMPAYQNFLLIWNAAGQTVTVKCSGGTGVAIPNGRKALVFCDGTDYFFSGPNYIGDNITETNARDIADKDYVDTAIATASLPATAGTVLVSGSDTTAGYLGAKITVAFASLTTTQVSGLTSLQISTQNPGAAEKVLATMGNGYVGGFLDGGLKSSQFTPSVGNSYDVDCTSAGFTVALSSMTTPQVGQEIKINKFGTNAVYFLGTVNGSSNLSRGDNFNSVLRYSGSSWGWNLMSGGVKSIQTGTITLTSPASSNTATITSVNTAKAHVIPRGVTFDNSATQPFNTLCRWTLTNATTVTLERDSGGTTGNVVGAFTVVEYY